MKLLYILTLFLWFFFLEYHNAEIFHSDTNTFLIQDFLPSYVNFLRYMVHTPNAAYYHNNMSFCTDEEIRTPIYGFGDRYSTIELHPCVLLCIYRDSNPEPAD